MIPKTYSQVELKLKKYNLSGNGGLAWIDKALSHAGFWEDIKKLSGKKKSNRELCAGLKVRSEILSRIGGATAIEDIEVLRADKGFEGMTGKKIVPADTIINFLSEKRTTFILKEALKRLSIKAIRESKETEFTYDNDATYFESRKRSAEYSYRGSKDFSGLLGFVPELNLCTTMEFRRGNISPREGILNQIKDMRGICERTGKRLRRIRLDSAGHNKDIFNYCNKEGIEFHITLCKNEAIKGEIANLREKKWSVLKRDKDTVEIAEFVYGQNDESTEAIRCVVIRRENKGQKDLFKEEYSYHVIGTNNIESEAEEILDIHSGRMSSENYNKELKEGYNIEWMPSQNYRKNANYFYIGVLAYSCVEFVKRFFIGGEVVKYRVKKFRNWFIKICGKLIRTGRRYIFHIINAPERSFEMFVKIRRRMRRVW